MIRGVGHHTMAGDKRGPLEQRGEGDGLGGRERNLACPVHAEELHSHRAHRDHHFLVLLERRIEAVLRGREPSHASPASPAPWITIRIAIRMHVQSVCTYFP